MAPRTSAVPEYLLSLFASLVTVAPVVALAALAVRTIPSSAALLGEDSPAFSAGACALLLLLCVAAWGVHITAFTLPPPDSEARAYLRVTYFRDEERGHGGLWLSPTALSLVTGLRKHVSALSSIRGVRVAPRCHWLLRLTHLVKDYPLVLDLDDGTSVRLFVYAPHFIANEILAARDTYADEASSQPYRRTATSA